MSCHSQSKIFSGVASAFDEIGVAVSFKDKLHSCALWQAAAAYLVAQYANLDWPSPDVIIPVTSKLQSKHCPSTQMAMCLAKILNKPVKTGPLQDKCIWLIDVEWKKGVFMRQWAEKLLEECPAQIYGLTLVREI